MSANQLMQIFAKPFRVRIAMTSDWHVGTGMGVPGSLDATVVRDADGVPFIPAKTLTGIWRDAMETLTYGLDENKSHGWREWIDEIFGNQPSVKKDPNEPVRPALLSLRPACLSAALRERLAALTPGQQTVYRQSLTFPKPEVRIDATTGSALDQALRFAEMGRIGAVLEAEGRLQAEDLSDVQIERIGALLIGSAALIERLGGKRRRGAGRCEVDIVGAPQVGEVTQLLDQNGETIPRPTRPAPGKFSFEAIDTGPDWLRVPYTLTLNSPVAIVTATLGNVAESLDRIPGTFLLPHVFRQCPNAFAAIAAGEIQLSPATPAVNGQRGMAAPQALSTLKVNGGMDQPATTFNGLAGEKPKSRAQVKNYRDGYVDSVDGVGVLPRHQRIDKELLMHNSVFDEKQRPTEDSGGVYSRQALRAGSELRGEIRFAAVHASELKPLFGKGFDVTLGVSKKDDYGLATLSFDRDPAELAPLVRAPVNGSIVVYAESDLILRNRTNLRLRATVETLQRQLEEELKVTLTPERAFVSTRRVENWLSRWNKPRPTISALAAGSCVKFRISEPADPNSIDGLIHQLEELEKSGIGERRGEGYGRVRFNLPLLAEPVNHWPPPGDPGSGPAKPASPDKPLSGADAKLAREIELHAWRKELHRAVLLIADDENLREEIFGFASKKALPPSNQIGSLRSVMMRLRSAVELSKADPAGPDGAAFAKKNEEEAGRSKSAILSWLAHLRDTRNRKKKWGEQAEQTIAKIRKLVEEPTQIWLTLCEAQPGGERAWQSPALLVRTKEEMQQRLWAEAVRALFDACARAYKRRLDEVGEVD